MHELAGGVALRDEVHDEDDDSILDGCSLDLFELVHVHQHICHYLVLDVLFLPIFQVLLQPLALHYFSHGESFVDVAVYHLLD